VLAHSYTLQLGKPFLIKKMEDAHCDSSKLKNLLIRAGIQEEICFSILIHPELE